METTRIQIDRDEAAKLYRAYRTHQHYSKPIDAEIERAYYLIGKGRMIIQALESIRLGGLDDLGLPKLGLARANQTVQIAVMYADGSAMLGPNRWRRRPNSLSHLEWPADAFPRRRDTLRAEAPVPLIPLPLRPKRGLENYYVLWEAEWRKAVPRDPMLLRRLGRADLWLVVAHWDLTAVEAAALSTRVNAA